MASVYVAQEVATGRRVALKLLAPELARDERFRRRFLRESELASGLHHPNIVETISSGEDPEHGLYLATAYVDGNDLRTLLRRDGPLDPPRAVALVEQIAAALDSAHAAGLVHRDVKPANVLVAADSEGEHAYVCDFGLARHVSSVSSLTGERGFVGTIDYVPPEQIEGGKIDARTDVYALGCLLFELLTGAKPFDRDSELSVVFAHLNEPPPSATELRPELPAAFDDIFRTALAKSPADRYGNCSDLARDARAALAGRKLSLRRRRRRIVAAAAVLAAVIVAVVALAVAESRSTSAHPSAANEITQTAIGGISLRHTRHWYTAKLGPSVSTVLSDPHFPTMSFHGPEMAVYFPAKGHGTRADIITAWGKNFRTPEGIGPCSSVAQMHSVYGKRLHADWADTRGKTHFAWRLGRNLLFITPKNATVTTVVLFEGIPHEPHGNSPLAVANFVGQNEVFCG
jgi:serine/threonine-protein kinase